MTEQQQREERLLARARKILLRRMQQGTYLSNPEEVKDYLRLQVGHLEHEVFGCLFLNNQHAVIAAEEMFRGTIDGASVYPREIVKRKCAVTLRRARVTVEARWNPTFAHWKSVAPSDMFLECAGSSKPGHSPAGCESLDCRTPPCRRLLPKWSTG